MQESILVTGGAGYIGSHTCKALRQKGFHPIAYDNLSTGHARLAKWGPLIQGDILDTEKLQQIMQEYKPKAVLHFAASALVTESMMHPEIYYKNNVDGSLSLLRAMKQAKIPYLIFSSSCAIYGAAQMLPIPESHPYFPLSPYGRSKLIVEHMIADFEKAYGIKSANLRYFNAAGADIEGETGEDHTPETHLIPCVIQAALGIKKQVTLYGKSFPSSDGTAVRDYIHVSDLAEAHVLALLRLLSGAPSFSLNLGTGQGTTILQIVQEVSSFYQKEIPITWAEKREGDPPILFADHRLAQNLLQWTPKYSSLKQIIESACKWHAKLI